MGLGKANPGAANAIVKAARGGAREYWLHLSTAQVIFGNMALPFWLDRILAGTAIDGQKQSGTSSDTERGNLFEPIHDLHRTEGRFGSEAGASALLVSRLTARLSVAAAGVVALVLVLIGVAMLGSVFGAG